MVETKDKVSAMEMVSSASGLMAGIRKTSGAEAGATSIPLLLPLLLLLLRGLLEWAPQV
jgi:hypothetical protein